MRTTLLLLVGAAWSTACGQADVGDENGTGLSCGPGTHAQGDQCVSIIAATCDNQIIETGETCDPPASCPASCDDHNACTTDGMSGAPSSCNVTCSNEPITQCQSDDGCCPGNCDNTNDNDCPPPMWSTTAVDQGVPASISSAIVLDSGDAPHIAYVSNNASPYVPYYEDITYYVKYARWTPPYWQTETIDTAVMPYGSTAEFFTQVSLALDDAGNPHIAYFGSAGLKYARWTGSEWNIQSVDATASDFGPRGLALDHLNRPHLGYSTPSAAKYAYWTGAAWQIEDVDVGTNVALALDSAGNAHMSYFGTANADLVYGSRSAGDWSLELVDIEGSAGPQSSLALDSEDQPHIAYAGNGNLRYAVWSDGVWHSETVDAVTYCQPSLALDSWNRPHIAYNGFASQYVLRYARWTGDVWNIEAVDAATRAVSLTLDASDHPHISYQGAVAGLQHASR